MSFENGTLSLGLPNVTSMSSMSTSDSTLNTTTIAPDLRAKASNNDEFMVWDSHNIFVVVFLIVIVVGLSCGLLGFICTRIIEDFYGDGLKPISVFKFNRRTANKQQPPPVMSTPTKIIVTRPASDTGTLINELFRDSSDPPIQTVATISGRKPKSVLKHQISVRSNHSNCSSNCEETIFSCDNSPAETPKEKKVYYWSKSNSFDYSNQNYVEDEPEEKKSSSPTPSMKKVQNQLTNSKHANQSRMEVNSPLGVYHSVISRSLSAPIRRSPSDTNHI